MLVVVVVMVLFVILVVTLIIATTTSLRWTKCRKERREDDQCRELHCYLGCGWRGSH